MVLEKIVETIGFIGVIEIIVPIFIALCGFFYYRKRLRRYYEVIWKKSSSLKPNTLLKGRPFDPEFYYERPEDKEIRKAIEKKENVLIIGMTLAGKTRAIYQAFTAINKSFDVTIPRCVNINFESFFVPKHFKFWRGRILLLDDLHRFVEVQNFEHLLRSFLEKNTVVIALCRSRIEYEKTKNMMTEKGMELSTIFGENVIEFPLVSETEGRDIAEKVGKDWGEIKFNRTIGSIFMPLEEMERRFDQSNGEEKAILRSIRLLYFSGIYEEKQFFPLGWIKSVCYRKYQMGKREFEWSGLIERLEKKEFITLKQDKIWVDEVYPETIIKMETEIPISDILNGMLTIFSNDLNALFRLGKRAHDIGTFDTLDVAVKAYEEALSLNPKNVFTWINKGQCLGNLNKYEEALECANKALELEPKSALANAFTWHNKGFYLYKLKRVEEAIECYDRSLTLDSNYAPAWYNKGYALHKLEKDEKAIECYNRSLELDPNNKVTWDNRGYSLFKLKRYEEAIGCYDRALKIDPKFVKPWNNKGQALGKLKRYEEALSCLDKALDLALESGLDKSDSEYVASIWDNKGYILNEQERYEEAIECFDKALNLNPKYVSSWGNKGYALRNLKGYEEAKECYDIFLNLKPEYKPEYVAIFDDMGFILSNMGKDEEAIGLFDKALELSDYKHVSAWINKGFSFAKLGKNEKAIECYEKAIELKPNNAAAWNYKGRAFENLEEYEETMKCYGEAIHIKPDYVDAWKNKGFCFEKLERYEEALECYEKVIEIEPNDEGTRKMKGYVFKKLGGEKALKYFNKALEIDSADPHAWDQKGYALNELERYEEAIECFDKALELNPKYASAWHNKIYASLHLISEGTPKELMFTTPVTVLKKALSEVDNKEEFIIKINRGIISWFKNIIFECKVSSKEGLISFLNDFEKTFRKFGVRTPSLDEIEDKCKASKKYEIYKDKMEKIFG